MWHSLRWYLYIGPGLASPTEGLGTSGLLSLLPIGESLLGLGGLGGLGGVVHEGGEESFGGLLGGELLLPGAEQIAEGGVIGVGIYCVSGGAFFINVILHFLYLLSFVVRLP